MRLIWDGPGLINGIRLRKGKSSPHSNIPRLYSPLFSEDPDKCHLGVRVKVEELASKEATERKILLFLLSHWLLHLYAAKLSISYTGWLWVEHL